MSGVPISKLVIDLGITRPTIYRKFREAILDDAFVKRVQELIGNSVTPDTGAPVASFAAVSVAPVTTRVTTQPSTVEEYANALISLQQKHIKLLEDYQNLLTRLYTGR